MGTITTDLTYHFTKDLHILYAEDDLELQAQTKDFLQALFASVTIVNDGAEALQMYKKNSYDIVISDVKMPIMDGIELTRKIKEIEHNQAVIIISAYNNSEYLLNFINLNIRYFIQKPINMDDLLESLYQTSKIIVNEKMIKEYRESLESNNQELTVKNEELHSLVRILDSKLLQIAKGDSPQKSDIDERKASINQSHLEELEELEIDISGAIVLLSLSKNITSSNIQELSSLLYSYIKILNEYPLYNELSESINDLANALHNAPDDFLEKLSEISTLLESFIYVLRLWREKIASKEFSKSFEFHSSMINDIVSIIDILNDTHNKFNINKDFFND